MGEDDSVVLVAPKWTGGKANVAVAKYLLEKKLGYDVEVRTMDEQDAWKEVGSGKADAILEDWGRPEEQTYVNEKKTVVPAGDLGVEGEVGWYVPEYLEEKYPGITKWQNLDKYADVLRTAKSGGKGQLLEGSPEFLTHDDAIIRNLGLNYKTVYTGSEKAQIAEMRQLAAEKKPFMTYWWRPHWLDLDVRMKKVELPPHYDGCDEDVKKVRCGYPEVPLQKFLSSDFSKNGGDGAKFLKNFQWGPDDQNKVAKWMSVDNLSPDAAAKKWVDANEGAWKVWFWGMDKD